MKSIIIASSLFLSVMLFIYSVNRHSKLNEELRQSQNQLVILAFEYGYNSGFNNCKRDSMIYIESSYKKDSIEIAKIVYE